MATSGVCSSWLILATNWFLCWLSISRSSTVLAKRPRLHLLEQSRVLYGNDSLVGEGRDKLDLLIAERLHHSAHQHDDAGLVCATEQRDAKYGAEAASALHLVESIIRI